MASHNRGQASILAAFTLLVIGSLAGVILSVSYRHSGEINASVAQSRAFFAAQAGANHALANLALDETGALGSSDAPLPCDGAAYWFEFEDRGDDTWLVRAFGRSGRAERALEVEVEVLEGGPFFHGVFAGNSSGDPAYVLTLNGAGAQNDVVDGSIYSGGDLAVLQDAKVTGTMRASGGVSGGELTQHESGRREPIPDLAAMHYEATAEVQVAQEFAAATYLADDLGGSAWQLPEVNPAHIFRKNPSDRLEGVDATEKDDYYLEDPYETVRLDSAWDGSDATRLSLSGMGGKPGESSNHKVFFVDGNLWLHNKKTYSFEFGTDGAGLAVTFVVKGNIYFADNLFQENDEKDGVAFIALRDPDVADSGNIYFGDPSFGTLRKMHAYMYAENDFYDTNLNSSSSSVVELVGNMTAGNQVKIQRDHERVTRHGTTRTHTKLLIDFDERVASGELVLPGLPDGRAEEDGGLTIVSWREVAR